MVHIIIMPRQGNTVESCIIVDWKIKEGDQVTDDTIICEVETDKAVFGIPAGAAGTVLKIMCNAGDDVPVLSPIAVIGIVGEDWQIVLNGSYTEGLSRGDAEAQSTQREERESGVGSRESGAKAESAASFQNAQIANNTSSPCIPVSPRARNLAEKEALPLNAVSGTGPEGRIIERDVLTALNQRPAMTAAAKAAVSDASCSEVSRSIPAVGSGIGGRVTIDDILSPLPIPDSAEGVITETTIKGIRKIVSERMLKSLAETAQFTLNASASVLKLQEFRKRMKITDYLPDEFKDVKITVNDFILFAVSRILPRFSYMNSHKTGDIIKTFERVHLGVAADTPRGLLVPVIRNANLLSLAQIAIEKNRLAAACKNGSAKTEELSGSTFSVTNLGSLGITGFTPVLNIPEVAILGVCGIEMKPAASHAEENCCKCNCHFEPHIGFSLTINHQAVDGAPAARFLNALCEAVTNIDILLESQK